MAIEPGLVGSGKGVGSGTMGIDATMLMRGKVTAMTETVSPMISTCSDPTIYCAISSSHLPSDAGDAFSLFLNSIELLL